MGLTTCIAKGVESPGEPDRRTALVSLGMILIPSVAFMIWTSPWFYSHFGVAVPLTQALLVLFTVYFFLITACSDPGILPRHPPRYQDVVINGNSIRLKFCTTCNIYRPPRSVHCAICDNCVERFDHHCPWLGNCIGLRNYRTFVFFVIFCSLLSVFSFVSSAVKVAFVVVWLREEGLTGDEVFHQLWGKATESILLLVYTFVLSWFVLALLAYHGYLISTNQTTYEQIKSFFYESNPWSKGLVGNLADVFCRPVRARYFNPLPSPINKDLSGDSARDTLGLSVGDCRPGRAAESAAVRKQTFSNGCTTSREGWVFVWGALGVCSVERPAKQRGQRGPPGAS
uniref:Palmitoyltransferase n=1 Tax=Neospora caninum (strain Liverpool) TaxID=572307 RepID=F0JB26_NEOCL|nr:hypothetical protein NCLIV_069490 [Neospora caninum Liverpool]CEL71292.1 TPA: hypothetical protein BN1204_069490 [Neospora caninum Liverpool]